MLSIIFLNIIYFNNSLLYNRGHQVEKMNNFNLLKKITFIKVFEQSLGDELPF